MGNFNFEIPDEDAQKIKTVNDLMEYIKSKKEEVWNGQKNLFN